MLNDCFVINKVNKTKKFAWYFNVDGYLNNNGNTVRNRVQYVNVVLGISNESTFSYMHLFITKVFNGLVIGLCTISIKVVVLDKTSKLPSRWTFSSHQLLLESVSMFVLYCGILTFIRHCQVDSQQILSSGLTKPLLWDIITIRGRMWAFRTPCENIVFGLRPISVLNIVYNTS